MNEENELYGIIWQEIMNGAYHEFGFIEDFYNWYADYIEDNNLESVYGSELVEGTRIELQDSLIDAFDLEFKEIEEDEEFYREDFDGPDSIY